jgi:Protein of unknown function (DUF1622)
MPVGEQDEVDAAMHLIATAIEVVGVAIIVVGALLASALFLYRGFGSSGWNKAYECFRAELGRGILLGLEFLRHHWNRGGGTNLRESRSAGGNRADPHILELLSGG